jgi:hypothetical protein
LTPGARYDFKFKDYAPWVFRQIREQFNIDPADYLVPILMFYAAVLFYVAADSFILLRVTLQISLTSKYILSELGSPGKSGSFFYYSRDYRFIIKTISHTEHKFMRSILKEYYEVKQDQWKLVPFKLYIAYVSQIWSLSINSMSATIRTLYFADIMDSIASNYLEAEKSILWLWPMFSLQIRMFMKHLI